MFQHEIHHFGRYLFGCCDEVAFVFAVFIVYNNHELTFFKVRYCLFYAIEFYF